MCLERLEELTFMLEFNDTLLSKFITHTPICCYVKDLDGKFIYANDALANLYNTTMDDLIGKSDYDFANEEEADKYKEADLSVYNDGERRELIELYTNDGNIHHMYSIKFKLDDIGIGGMSIDLDGTIQKLLTKMNTKLTN
jgi:PAS domain S-box-containing protein